MRRALSRSAASLAVSRSSQVQVQSLKAPVEPPWLPAPDALPALVDGVEGLGKILDHGTEYLQSARAVDDGGWAVMVGHEVLPGISRVRKTVEGIGIPVILM